MTRALRAALVLAACVVPLAAHAQENRLDMSSGRLRFQFAPGQNIRLSVDGVPVIQESVLYIVRPNWAQPLLLNQNSETPAIRSFEENGRKVGTAEYDAREAWAKFRFELSTGNTFSMSVTYGKKDASQPAYVQHWAAMLNADLLAGAPYTADTVDGPRKGVTPMFATTSDQTESRLIPNGRSITFDTVLGRIAITAGGSDAEKYGFTLFDARMGTADWARKNPIFWLGVGVPDPEVTPGEHSFSLTFTFGQPLPKSTMPRAEGQAKVIPLAAAKEPYVLERPVIPRPKSHKKPAGQPFRLGPATRIVIRASATLEEKNAARELQNVLKAFHGIAVPIIRSDARAAVPAKGDISLAPISPSPKTTERASRIAARPEGYLLDARARDIHILGADPRGVYYGAQTLKQLFRMDKAGVYVRPASIEDWPSLGFRGVHWFGGPKSLPFHQRMITRIIAPLKMNAMVYQADYTQWETQPKVWSVERSTPKADVARAVAFARNHFLEPIPMVNGIGHAEWLFWNGQNLDIASDPTKPYAYNPENPRSYEVLFPIMQEAIDLFRPRFFHLGNDEVTMTGKFPAEGVTKSVTQIIIEDTKRRHDWLKQRGIKTMMWGDMLLHPSEVTDAGHAPSREDAKARRDALPKDIVIADWHYQGSDPRFPSVELLQKEGYPVVGTTWFDWGNIEKFSRVLNENNAMGFLQSTWAGYAMSMDTVSGPEFKQFVAYLLGAEYAWNGAEITLGDLGYSPEETFLELWARTPVRVESWPGFTVDLTGLSNAAMWEWIPTLEDAPRGGSASPFPVGRASLGGIAYDTGHPVLLAGGLNPVGVWPLTAVIPLNGSKARELHFLWATTTNAPFDTRVATVKIAYTDGTQREMPVDYGNRIFAFGDTRSSLGALIAWRGQDPLGREALARRSVWENPHPGKPIASVTITSANSAAAPVLLGLTGVRG